MANSKLTTGSGIKDLTPEGREYLKRCWRANPEGCRSADGECGPPPTYPCMHYAGVSLQEFWTLVADWKDQEAATLLDEDMIQ